MPHPPFADAVARLACLLLLLALGACAPDRAVTSDDDDAADDDDDVDDDDTLDDDDAADDDDDVDDDDAADDDDTLDDDDAVDDDDTLDDDDDVDDDDVVDDDDTADDDDATSSAVIVGTRPANGATDVFSRPVLWADFDVAVSPTLSLADADGVGVPGTQANPAETRHTFEPTAALVPLEGYELTISWPGDTEVVAFTVSATGTTPAAPQVGQTFSLDLGSGTSVQPGAEQFVDQMNTSPPLLGITWIEVSALHLRIAPSVPGSDPPEQDLSGTAVDLDESGPAVWEDPWFQTAALDVPNSFEVPNVGLFDLTHRDLTLSGSFDGAGGMVGVRYTATVDLRDSGLGLPCAQMGLFVPGIICVSCPHDPAFDECIGLDLIDIPAELVPGLTLVP